MGEKDIKKFKMERKIFVLLNGVIMFSGLFLLDISIILAFINLFFPVIILFMALNDWGIL